MRHPWLIAVFALFFSSPAAVHAEEILMPEKVLQSSLQHFPKILESASKVEAAEGKVLHAEGAFDARIDQDLYARGSGYYDGRQTDARLVKPFPFMNSQLYGGYRVSDGSFPIYEDELITQDAGEFLFGAQMSLLRNRMIDERRLSLANQKLEREMAQWELLLTQLAVQHDALYHYWQWLAAGHVRDVYQNLLDIAEKRQRGFEERVKRGDVAAIYLTENKQYLLRRQVDLNEAERMFRIKANALSLYLRDGNGTPQTPVYANIPKEFPNVDYTIVKQKAVENLAQRPELRKIAQHITQFENEAMMGENMLMPKADLNLEYSQDRGDGSITRDPHEALIKLDISIPLQFRTGQGKMQEARARIKQLQQERRLLEDKLLVELENAFTNLQIAKQYVELTAQEIELARTMQEAERVRFDNGESDFFVVNMREQKTAEAEIKHIKAQEAYRIALTHLNALTMDFQALGMQSLCDPTSMRLIHERPPEMEAFCS